MNKIVIDESVDYRIVKKLKETGFDVISILETNPGIDDEEVLNIAFQEKAVLLTEDTDFGELTYRLKRESYGILLIRLIGIPGSEKPDMVVDVINSHLEEIRNNFAVLSIGKLRIKKIK